MSLIRRQFLGATDSSLLVNAIRPAEAVALSTKDERPNFLFMIADDMTFRTIHALNNPEVHTPNLDRLVAQGTVFTHCFHQGSWMPAVCAPSRTMLNSGLICFQARDAAQRLSSYQPNDVDDIQSKLLAVGDGPRSSQVERSLGDYIMWVQNFRAHGYNTLLTGKWHMDDVALQRSFSEIGPNGPGMYRSTGINGTAYLRPPKENSKDPWNPADRSLHGQWIDTSLIEPGKPKQIKHCSEYYADHVCDYLLTKAAKRKEPFFIYLGWNAPHDPRQAPQEFLDLYPEEKVDVPKNFLPEHPFNEGDHWVRDEQLAPWPRTPRAVQVHRREYYAILSHMDTQIGRIFAALEKSGKAKNTYVIMTADHGLCMGEHGLMGKQNIYEASMRIPLIVSGPGVPTGKRVDELVYQHCLYATTTELAGLPLPQHVEFPSLVALLKEKPKPVYDAVFGYYKNYCRSARNRTHKIVVYPGIKKTQIFDMTSDPYETNNLYGKPEGTKLHAPLLATLEQLQKQLGDNLDIDYPTGA